MSDSDTTDALKDARSAILEAARHDLDFARQYIDKFDNWSDYVLATFYHARALALSIGSDIRETAAEEFKEVNQWLKEDKLKDEQWERLSERQKEAISSRSRIRAEAMLNRAVLVGRGDNRKEAAEQLYELIDYLENDVNGTPMRGIRLVAEVALLKLEAEGVKEARQRLGSPRWPLAELRERMMAERRNLAAQLIRDEGAAFEEKREWEGANQGKDNRKEAPNPRFLGLFAKKTLSVSLARNTEADLQSKIAKARKDLWILDSLKSEVDSAARAMGSGM